jgi:D-amino peptidase
MNEASFNAAIAGHFNVPVIMVTGDDATIAETRALIGEFEPVITKEAISYHAAQLKSRAVVLEMIREAAGRAVSRIDEFRPYKPDSPVTMEVSLKNYRPVQLLTYLPVFTLKDSHTVSYTARDMTEASRVLEFILSYQVGITP